MKGKEGRGEIKNRKWKIQERRGKGGRIITKEEEKKLLKKDWRKEREEWNKGAEGVIGVTRRINTTMSMQKRQEESPSTHFSRGMLTRGHEAALDNPTPRPQIPPIFLSLRSLHFSFDIAHSARIPHTVLFLPFIFLIYWYFCCFMSCSCWLGVGLLV